MTKKNIVFDELEKAKEIESNGFPAERATKYYLGLLAKYYHLLGFAKKEIEKKLISFCYKYSFGFNEILYSGLIKYALSRCDKYPLKTGKVEIPITKSEFETIKKYPINCAKVAFVMIVLAKYEKYYNNSIKRVNKEKYKNKFYCNMPYGNIFRLAKVNTNTSDKIDDIIYFLDGIEHFVSLPWKKDCWEINVIDETSETFIVVDDIYNIIGFFPFYCEKCGKIIEKKAKKHSMCEECYREHRKETIRNNSREYWRKNH